MLDLVGAERPAVARDDVLGPCDVPEEALLVLDRDVAGQVQIAAVGALGLFRGVPVAGEQRRRVPADREVALDAVRKLVALVVDDRDLVPGKGASDRARLPDPVAGVADHDVRLRLAVAVVERQAPALLEDLDDLRLEDVSRGDESTESW